MKLTPYHIPFIRTLSALGLSPAAVCWQFAGRVPGGEQSVRRLLRGDTYGGTGKVCAEDRDTASSVRRVVRRVMILTQQDGPRHPTAGICYALSRSYEYQIASHDTGLYMKAALRAAMMSWPKYSGDFIYPIPGGGMAYDNHRAKWDRTTEYGRLRWELLDWIIQELAD